MVAIKVSYIHIHCLTYSGHNDVNHPLSLADQPLLVDCWWRHLLCTAWDIFQESHNRHPVYFFGMKANARAFISGL